jgi:hypothetical protein
MSYDGNISYVSSFNKHSNLFFIKKPGFTLPRFFNEERGLSYQIAQGLNRGYF